MQIDLPFINAMLSDWYLLTLNNALYAAALATTVWLLTSMLYSIRIAALKRSKAAGEKAAIENLNAMQQQLQQSQEALVETNLQMEKAQRSAQDETQRALALEQLIYQRNQQVAGVIQSLATSFDLGERPLLATEDVKADALWQQHDKVISQLTERLRSELQAKTELQQTYKAEAAKLAEKEALLKALQSTLDNHSKQLSKLELALEEQKSMLQHQDNAQQLICDTLKQYQPAPAQVAAPAPEIPQQPLQVKESPIVIEEIPATLPSQDSPAEQAEEPETTVSLQFEQTPVELTTTVEDIAPAQLDITPPQAEPEAVSVEAGIEQQAVAPAKGSLGKIKGLFGRSKQQPVKTEPQWTVAKTDEIEAQPLPSDADAEPQVDDVSETAPNKPGKLKGFYSKFRSKGK